MRRRWMFRLLAIVGSTIVALAVVELGLRSFVKPSERSSGRLWGRELPPWELIDPGALDAVPSSAPLEGLIVDGTQLTRGDLWGLIRPDPVLGYVTQEASRSENGYWESNQIGARSRNETTPVPEPGMQRVLVFGDSYAHGSRVKQEETWTRILDDFSPGLEVLNFGVDGYGLTQSLLRYRRVRARLDYDVVLMMWVPSADLPRDVNVSRALMGWGATFLLPRFVLRNEGIELVTPPVDRLSTDSGDGSIPIPPRVRSHLRRYDMLYWRSKYEEPPLLGGLTIVKLLARADHTYREKRFMSRLMNVSSEPMRVSGAILRTMAEEATDDDARFVLVVLPMQYDVERYQNDDSFRETWDSMIRSISVFRGVTIDLMEDLRAHGPLDKGLDGTHYGPDTSAVIGRSIGGRLDRLLRNLDE